MEVSECIMCSHFDCIRGGKFSGNFCQLHREDISRISMCDDIDNVLAPYTSDDDHDQKKKKKKIN